MNYFKEVLDYLTKLFQWWVIIEPWESGIRVRFGKHTRVLTGGIYFRIPFFDAVYVQEIRMRMYTMPPQTVTTRDGQTITIFSSVGYSIQNVLTLYNSIAQPDTTIGNTVLGLIAGYVTKHNLSDCKPETIEDYVNGELSKLAYGIKFESVKVTGYAVVRTYRILQDHSMSYDNLTLTNKR